MPRCISCNEVYADQLRRCPHCGDAPDGGRDGIGSKRRLKPESPLGRAARGKRITRVAILGVALGGLALVVSISVPGSPVPTDEVAAYEDPILDAGMWDGGPLASPDEVQVAEVKEGFAVTEARVRGDKVHVTGTCSPDAAARILVDEQPAVLTPRGDRFRAVVPLDTGMVEVVALGIKGDRVTLTKPVDVDRGGEAPGEVLRLLSHAEGSTVHDGLLRLTLGSLDGTSPSRMEDVALNEVENRITVENSTFLLYRAPRGLKFLRTSPQGHHTFLREQDGQEMVLIPGGVARRGMGDGPPDGPLHVVRLNPYLIDRTEVTCRQYAAFLHAMARENSFSLRHTEDPGVTLRPVGWKSDDPPAGRASHPVTGIAWYAAHTYARWVGGQLPSEAEWERAAAGVRGHAYPWGDKLEPERCHRQAKGTLPAASLPGGESPTGLLHMSGNVREWCVDRYDPRWYLRGLRTNPHGPARNQHRVVRGGSFQSGDVQLRLQHRDHFSPTEKAPDLGFRVAWRWVELDEHSGD
ncbi:MAG: formylglycine-generating enzyme family protein [Planctomycetota bacterium]|jgi:formylglycine-generating enzyme required for sulfatase activity